MDALNALHNRVSVNLLSGPAPTKLQIKNIVKAGLRACDHKNLRPWKFLIIEEEARLKFGELMMKTKLSQQGTAVQTSKDVIKLKEKPLRAPTIIAVIADLKDHPKVPEIEQLISTGAAAQMMMTAAYAQGLGAIWRSGGLMYEGTMHEGLGLSKNQRLVGFIYLGQPIKTKPTPLLDPDDFISGWGEA